MAARLPIDADDDDDYASSQDSDFALDQASKNGNDTSDSDDNDDDNDGDGAGQTTSRRHHINATSQTADEYDNSGDEAILKKGRKRRKIAAKADQADDDGEAGGLIKTRRQRAVEKEQRHEREVHVASSVTFDAQAVYAEMLAESRAAERHKHGTPRGVGDQERDASGGPASNGANGDSKSTLAAVRNDGLLADEDQEKAKMCMTPAEEAAAAATNGEQAAAPKRRIKKAFRSRFDPGIIEARMRRGDLDLGVAARLKAGQEAEEKKMNVVEKSRRDWAAHVDEAGFQKELDEAGKAKDSYATKEEFLARRDAARLEIIKSGGQKRVRLHGRD